MISLTRLLCGTVSFGDGLRYGRAQEGADRRPIVVWTSTRRCNLNCIHCYSDSGDTAYEGELSTDEARGMIRDLHDFGVPVLLFSGGEPLLRKDLFDLNVCAHRFGLRTVISTNGTLITPRMARQIREDGFSYVGVSLDGIAENNDRIRGKKGAFDLALYGIRNLKAAGQKVGLRFTVTRHNQGDLPAVFRLVEDEGIERVCFYHLAYAGRGAEISRDDLTHAETRRVVDEICAWTVSLHERGMEKEVLTVDNHADGVYLYLKLKEKDPVRAGEVYRLLEANGGNASGIAIAQVDSRGFVHPDQFSPEIVFGNVRDRKFGDIWADTSQDLLAKFRDRQRHLKGRCSRCKHIEICNGNLRSRAWAARGDLWEADPACYLTDGEIQKAAA